MLQCDREDGIGADGVLFLTIDSTTSPARITMDLRQPDGSIGSMCGNAARCVGKWASDFLNLKEIIIETPAGAFPSKVFGEDIQIKLSSPSFEPADVPILSDSPFIDQDILGLSVTAVNAGGVTHSVAFVDDINDPTLINKAIDIRHSDMFPEGTNVTFAQEIQTGFKQRTFERGVENVTLACGTRACAIVSILYHSKQITCDQPICVTQEGGEDLFVIIQKTGSTLLRGPATHEFSGEFSPL